ncbi:MAG TPA: NAD(P)-binding domain-containing protein [Thermoanaerobaculia bacterium]|nr:NAD(P)-binding domain-containing protein [Thermoanaerobaculia bacterium]
MRAMKIGIIGAGHIGGTMAHLLVAAGHDVAISNSRGPETLQPLVAELGERARAATAEEAAAFGEVVLLATPLKEYTSLPVRELRGKIAIDAMNYYPNRDGHYDQLDAGTLGSSELVAAHLPETRIVKAFNTIWFEHLKKQGDTSKAIGDRRAIFIAGDDAEAKGVVTQLIESIGFGAFDMGSLAGGRKQQPDTAVYNRELTVEQAKSVAP